jgi:serine protease AprX
MRVSTCRVRRKAVWGSGRGLILLLGLATAISTDAAAATTYVTAKPGVPSSRVKAYKLDDELTRRAAGNPASTTRVIVRLVPGAQLPPEFKKFARGMRLDVINGEVLDLPNGLLRRIAAHPNVFRVHYDRPLKPHNYRTSVTVGARDAIMNYGLTGAGVGIAVIDSGITTWHDDLVNYSTKVYTYGNQRVAKFVDFVNGRTLPYDDHGHGTHVAGTIAGVGYDSKFEKAGIAPLASLIALKVLDANGAGTVSNIIAALNWAIANSATYNIRVVNMSVGAPVYESYWTDPLTLAAKAAVDNGITVVAAAGNLGMNSLGQLQWGGITAPGNAPWVLTVGASTTMGTVTRSDDQMAPFSSSGPTHIDYGAKPDLVAPGTGTVSLSVPNSLLYATKPWAIINGSNGLPTYLSLSGTSMAAPVVSGTVALMLQANPYLTPNAIKAILQYTAQTYPGYSPLRQGAGFLNTLGAVQLARFYAKSKPGTVMASIPSTWSKSVIWGNHRLTQGFIQPTANAWAKGLVWGSARTMGATGDPVVWGTMSTTTGNNVVWGTECGDALCDNVVWGTTTDGDNVVWGTDCGGADCDNVVWGTNTAGDNVVWGTCEAGDNVVWGTSALGDNVVWGTSADGDNIVWGMSNDDPDFVVDADAASEPLPSVQVEFGTVVVPEITATSIEDVLTAPSIDATGSTVDPTGSTVDPTGSSLDPTGSTTGFIGGGL